MCISNQKISQDVFLKTVNDSQPIHTCTLAMQVRKGIICWLSYSIYMYMYMYVRGAGMAQWWERSLQPACPRFDSGPYHMWADSVGGSCLAMRLFLQVLPFSFFQKNQHSKFQFDKDRGPTWKPTKANAIIFFFANLISEFCRPLYILTNWANFVFCKDLILAQGNVFTQH